MSMNLLKSLLRTASKLEHSNLLESVEIEMPNATLHSYTLAKPGLSLNPIDKSPFNSSFQLILSGLPGYSLNVSGTRMKSQPSCHHEGTRQVVKCSISIQLISVRDGSRTYGCLLKRETYKPSAYWKDFCICCDLPPVWPSSDCRMMHYRKDHTQKRRTDWCLAWLKDQFPLAVQGGFSHAVFNKSNFKFKNRICFVKKGCLFNLDNKSNIY